ncbi:MAG: hypothetical protein V3S55_03910 [Nitrospiraceae bacterium]
MTFIEFLATQSWWESRFMWGIEAYRDLVDHGWAEFMGGSSVRLLALEELIG